jgi:hypothetical protein
MNTIAIQIGNSDDKLTQKQWACFVLELRSQVDRCDCQIHFWGASVNYEPWQNLCCVCTVPDREGLMERFLRGITNIRKRFDQESAAVLIGETKFI